MSKGKVYEEIMAVLRKHAESDTEYWNPNFLSEVNHLLEVYGDIEDPVVGEWINGMWGR